MVGDAAQVTIAVSMECAREAIRKLACLLEPRFQHEAMSFHSGEYSHQSFQRGFFDGTRATCHGSVSGKTVDSAVQPASHCRLGRRRARHRGSNLNIPPAQRGAIIAPRRTDAGILCARACYLGARPILCAQATPAHPMSKPADPLVPAKSLHAVVGQGERVQDLVDEAAEDLGSVNVALKAELASQVGTAAADDVIEKSEAVEGKVQEAADELSVMNRALKAEVRERHALEVQLETVTEQGQADRHASLHDGLTGLPNRALFHDRLEHGIAQARRHGWTLAVMFVDLDDFKRINDDYGHEVGDFVLCTIAERLTKNTRRDDTVSRHGGDEFLYLLLEIKREEDVAAIVRSLGDVIAAPCELEVNGVVTPLVVGSSIGVSIFPRDGATGEQLIAAADKAMYVVKRSRPSH